MSSPRKLAVLVLLLASGCAVGPNFHTPPAPHVDRYAALPGPDAFDADGSSQALEMGQAPAAAWWRLFGSDALDGLVAEGLGNSPTLASARAALLQSQDQARAGAGVFYPSLDASFSATRERSSPAALDGRVAPATFNLFTLGGEVGYAVDLFGGKRRSVEALTAAADRQKYAVGSAYLLLTGNIVDTAIARAGYAEQGAALSDIVRLETGQRDILKAEYEAGDVAWSAVLQAEQQLAADQETLAGVDQRQAAAETFLKTLTGREAGEAMPAAPSLGDLRVPADAPVSLPSEIVRQRPDILQAEASLHQASAQVGVATAALFPSITISGDYGGASTVVGQLGAAAGRFWSVGPELNVPIFEGGQLWFTRKAALAALAQAQADYRQTVLAALEQAADSLKALDADDQTARAARSAFDAAKASGELAAANDQAGVIADYDALTAEIQSDRARLDLIAAETQRLQDVVALYLASGGGWNAHASVHDLIAEAAK